MKMENAKSPATSASSSQSGRSSSLGSSSHHTNRNKETAHCYNIMVEYDENNTREMAVDVPESFIAHTKTPPKYPPPRQVANGILNSSGRSYDSPVGGPTLVSRDHLRIEQDGYLLNTKSGPSPARDRKNQYDIRPDEQQKERIQMYSEEITKRKLELERRERSEEFLRHSIRDSQKMQALKETSNGRVNNVSGLSNNAYITEEFNGENGLVMEDQQPQQQMCPDMKEIFRAVHRLEQSGVLEGQVLSSVQSLINSDDFVRTVNVNQKLHTLFPRIGLKPQILNAQDLTEEILNDLERFKSLDAEEEELKREALSILCSENIEALLCAHDVIAQRRSAPQQQQQLMSQVNQEALRERLSHYTEPNIKVVRIEKTSDPLGATVRNEDDGAVVVGRIIRGGTAESTGLLQEGDEILEVNEVPMRGKNVNEVCDILANMTGTLTLLVVPSRQQLMMPYEVNVAGKKSTGPIMHVKAHIDYDPNDDPYVPCRELGLSFMKGDILHVINQKDPHWWQAKHDGDEENQLPGLIPSASFQQQREAVKHTIAQDTSDASSRNGQARGQKTTGFLCAKRSGRKKKNKTKRLGFDDHDMDPENGTFGSEEIITYEEVAMYYPRSDRKRPVVLIGPPNIGRHELRQRLMQDSDRFAAAIPHTSRAKRPDEIDSQDYHFISRQQFEHDIVARKFVEHGEYEKAYYGTSLAAIRSVVHQDKICVLNLHPQSLKILKNSDLMPFVVFVAPPSLEKLRRWKMEHSMEQVNDNELKDIIERAREMEDVYGHFFDMVIIYSHPEHAYEELLKEINLLEREPQWVPAAWLAKQSYPN